MPHDPRKSLQDMLKAARLVVKFTTGRTQADYLHDEFLGIIELKLPLLISQVEELLTTNGKE